MTGGPAAAALRLNLADEGSGWTAALTADRCDELGCLVWDLTLRRTGGSLAMDAATLRGWADRVAGKVTGLLEPLTVVEVDAERLVAQLRSNEPTSRARQIFLLRSPPPRRRRGQRPPLPNGSNGERTTRAGCLCVDARGAGEAGGGFDGGEISRRWT